MSTVTQHVILLNSCAKTLLHRRDKNNHPYNSCSQVEDMGARLATDLKNTERNYWKYCSSLWLGDGGNTSTRSWINRRVDSVAFESSSTISTSITLDVNVTKLLEIVEECDIKKPACIQVPLIIQDSNQLLDIDLEIDGKPQSVAGSIESAKFVEGVLLHNYYMNRAESPEEYPEVGEADRDDLIEALINDQDDTLWDDWEHYIEETNDIEMQTPKQSRDDEGDELDTEESPNSFQIGRAHV